MVLLDFQSSSRLIGFTFQASLSSWRVHVQQCSSVQCSLFNRFSNCSKYCRRAVGTHMDPRFTQKTVTFAGAKSWLWVTTSLRLCRVDGNTNTCYTPNHSRGQIIQQDDRQQSSYYYLLFLRLNKQQDVCQGLKSDSCCCYLQPLDAPV